jgi:hypothetical protein
MDSNEGRMSIAKAGCTCGGCAHLSSFFTKPQEGPKSRERRRNMPQMMYLTCDV